MTEFKVRQPAKSTEAAQRASSSSDASLALLADAQRFSLTLAINGSDRPSAPGGYTNNTDVMTLPNMVNDKMNSVNAMSAADRQTWLQDFHVVSGQADYDSNPGIGDKAPVGLVVNTGTNGKITSFQITSSNYDEKLQSSTAVLDGTVGLNGPQNVHFDASNTQPGFLADEISGFDRLNRNPQNNTASKIGQWAAEAQAMPAAGRAAMIREAQAVFPQVGWNTDPQGVITSVVFNGQPITPSVWGQSLEADASAKAARAEKEAAEVLADRKADLKPSTDDGSFYGSAGSTAPSSAGSARGSSYPPEGTVVQGVGSDPGLYISNGNGTVSKW